MKILFIGDSQSAQYVIAFYNEARRRENITAELFDYGKIKRDNIITRLELHYKIGFMIHNLNKRIIRICELNRYDLVFVYYSTLLYGKTINKIKNTGTKVFMYCNDNPFSDGYKHYIWRHLKRQIPFYDIIYAYRESNIEEYEKAGANNVKLMKSYYIEDRNYYIPDEKIELSVPEVVYIGHKEDDGRELYIESLLSEGINVGLNHAWKEFGKTHKGAIVFDKKIATSRYNEILNKSKIAIVFLSKLNEDGYTRRCFEIPAVKTMMIAPYTHELAEMYEENKEVVFFRNKDEFVSKIKYYIGHSREREQIAENGYMRLVKSKNNVSDRLDRVIEDYCEYK